MPGKSHPTTGGKALINATGILPGHDDDGTATVLPSGHSHGQSPRRHFSSAFNKIVSVWCRDFDVLRATGLTAKTFQGIAYKEYARLHPQNIGNPRELEEHPEQVVDAIEHAWTIDNVMDAFERALALFHESGRPQCHLCAAPATVVFKACGHLVECRVCNHYRAGHPELYNITLCPVCGMSLGVFHEMYYIPVVQKVERLL